MGVYSGYNGSADRKAFVVTFGVVEFIALSIVAALLAVAVQEPSPKHQGA